MMARHEIRMWDKYSYIFAPNIKKIQCEPHSRFDYLK